MTLDRVRDMYCAMNGDHPMTPADDAYVRRHFVPIPDDEDYSREQILDLMIEEKLPLPAYLLLDGTPMVHRDYLTPVRTAGSVEALPEWFRGHWPACDSDIADDEWSDGYLSGQYVCLWSVNPTTIRAKAEAIESIKAEVAELEAGTGSLPRLAEAVNRLDRLEPPFTEYDQHRFGSRTSRQVWIDDVREKYLTAIVHAHLEAS